MTESLHALSGAYVVDALVLPTLAVIGIWQLLGFNMVLFMAGLYSNAASIIAWTSSRSR